MSWEVVLLVAYVAVAVAATPLVLRFWIRDLVDFDDPDEFATFLVVLIGLSWSIAVAVAWPALLVLALLTWLMWQIWKAVRRWLR